MPSTYTLNNGIEKPATGEQNNTWGDTCNDDFDIIDQALDGQITLTLVGASSTLTITDGAVSDGRNRVLVCTGSPGANHTLTIAPNDAEKYYFVKNQVTGGFSVTIRQGGGSGATVTIPNGYEKIVRVDGTGSNANAVELMASPYFGGTVRADATIMPLNTPGGNWTISQNSVSALVSVESGAKVNTLYLTAGAVLNGYTAQMNADSGTRVIGVRGDSARGVFETSTAAADGDTVPVGSFEALDRNATGSTKVAGAMVVTLSGGTANNRGGRLTLFTKQNNGVLADGINITNTQTVGVGGGDPHTSAVLACNSTTKGFLPPKMTQTQRDAISSPTAGLLICNTNTGQLNFYDGSSWRVINYT